MNINQMNLPQLLIGRSIIAVSEQLNILTLDNDLSLTVVPFQHCAGCDHGSYQVDEVAAFPVPIENVRVSTEFKYNSDGSMEEIITIIAIGQGVEKPVITVSGNPDIIIDTAEQVVAEEIGVTDSLRTVQSLKEAGLLSSERFHIVMGDSTR